MKKNKAKGLASTGCAETIRFPHRPMEAEKAAKPFHRYETKKLVFFAVTDLFSLFCPETQKTPEPLSYEAKTPVFMDVPIRDVKSD